MFLRAIVTRTFNHPNPGFLARRSQHATVYRGDCGCNLEETIDYEYDAELDDNEVEDHLREERPEIIVTNSNPKSSWGHTIKTYMPIIVLMYARFFYAHYNLPS